MGLGPALDSGLEALDGSSFRTQFERNATTENVFPFFKTNYRKIAIHSFTHQVTTQFAKMPL